MRYSLAEHVQCAGQVYLSRGDGICTKSRGKNCSEVDDRPNWSRLEQPFHFITLSDIAQLNPCVSVGVDVDSQNFLSSSPEE